MNDSRRWWWVPVLGALLCGGITALLVTNWVAGRVEDGAVAALEAAGLDTAVDYVGVDGLNGIGRDGVNVVLEGPAADETAAVEAVAARSEVDQVVYRVVEGDATRGVIDYLVTTGTVDAERLEAEGRGESELVVDPEITPEVRQRNRRIEWELRS